MREIILASASPRRAELLRQIGLSFEVIPSEIEENIDLDLCPEEIVQNLSLDKALSVAQRAKDSARSGAVIIGADTIVVKDKILGKPKDKADAFEMLKDLEGDWHTVITGIAIVDSVNMHAVKSFEKTKVRMRQLSDSEINSYIRTGEPMDKAGAYGVQGLGAVLVERIEGCYFNVVGLPLNRLEQMLKEFKMQILED